VEGRLLLLGRWIEGHGHLLLEQLLLQTGVGTSVCTLGVWVRPA